MRYQIKTTREGNKHVARVSLFVGSDQRDGDRYDVVTIALGDTEDEALRAAVAEAFDLTINEAS